MEIDIEQTRRNISLETNPEKKSLLGQYFTPFPIANFMASLFAEPHIRDCKLLDPGAGIGSLTNAFLNRFLDDLIPEHFSTINIHAFEIDTHLQPHLSGTLSSYSSINSITSYIFLQDFIQYGVNQLRQDLFSKEPHTYTHIIMNPPYKKIRSDSIHRKLLSQVGIETVNLYTAFLSLGIYLLEPHGEMVAIIPRSFCNGPYYLSFRKLLLSETAIKRIHVFESRSQAFKDDDVLQENIILHIERSGIQNSVGISFSNGLEFDNLTVENISFDHIIIPGDDQLFIHIPLDKKKNSIDINDHIQYSLSDIGVEVSTGPVVDFRVKSDLESQPDLNSVPLVYPSHFSDIRVEWPKLNSKKPNAIRKNERTSQFFYPNGFYTVVKRFSAKEEKKRITANLVDPTTFPDQTLLGFENHLNVFHTRKNGLPEDLAMGLYAYLNTTAVDQYFRRFNGHTQVNATDLRAIKYPSRRALIKLGRWIKGQSTITQELIDKNWEKIIS